VMSSTHRYAVHAAVLHQTAEQACVDDDDDDDDDDDVDDEPFFLCRYGF